MSWYLHLMNVKMFFSYTKYFHWLNFNFIYFTLECDSHIPKKALRPVFSGSSCIVTAELQHCLFLLDVIDNIHYNESFFFVFFILIHYIIFKLNVSSHPSFMNFLNPYTELCFTVPIMQWLADVPMRTCPKKETEF